jgi:hypothetical protein
MKKADKLTVFFPSGETAFERDVRMSWKGKPEKPKIITTHGQSIMIGFESGLSIQIEGLPYIYESFRDPEDIPF